MMGYFWVKEEKKDVGAFGLSQELHEAAFLSSSFLWRRDRERSVRREVKQHLQEWCSEQPRIQRKRKQR